MSLDPIALQGSLHETIWGGQHLATVAGKTLPAGALVGESWETALDSRVISRPYAGQTLGDVTRELGVRLYGTRAQEIFGGRFPLLAKFIDAHDWLSVQVHPDDTYAHEHENGKLGKTEAWRILRTEPDAQIIHGLEKPETRQSIAAAIQDVKLEALTHRLGVSAGDVVLNQAGTLHATGAGIVLYEIQEYSDVTYRLYDYGRLGPDGKGRELHIDKGLDALNYQPLTHHLLKSIPIDVGADGAIVESLLVACHHFALAELVLCGEYPTRITTDGTSCHILTLIEGQADLTWGAINAPAGLVLTLGDTVVLPAEAAAYHLDLEPSEGHTRARILHSWVPIADDPRVRAWTAAQG